MRVLREALPIHGDDDWASILMGPEDLTPLDEPEDNCRQCGADQRAKKQVSRTCSRRLMDRLNVRATAY